MAITAPTTEIGYTQTPNYNWWLYENETTPELIWPMSVYVYDQMRRQDAQVGSVLRAVTETLLRTPWRIDPAGARPKVVKFVADDLGLPIVGKPVTQPSRLKDRFSWPTHLREALLMLPYGHSYFEQVYRVDDAGTAAHLRKLAYRPAKTIERIDVAPDGGLIAIKQWWTTVDRRPEPIPVNRLVAYIHAREGGNWLGTSILRNCYKNWLLKDRLLRVQAQTIERNGMGIPLYTANESETDLSAGLSMATKWRAGEAAGSAIPFGATLRLVGVEGTLPDAEPAIRYHDEQIARAVLAHFLNLGTQTGSWALGSTFADFFVMSLQTLAEQIRDTATSHIIEDLVDINFGENEPAPRLVFDEIGSRQAATAAALKTLVDAGVIRPDEVLEESSRQQYGLPPADPSTVRKPPAPSGQQDVMQPPTETGALSTAVAANAGPKVDAAGEPEPVAAVAGMDTHPGGEQLKHWWVYGEGAALWATWTELEEHLLKYLKPEVAKRTAQVWYHLRYGHYPPHGDHKAVKAALPADDGEATDWHDAIAALIKAIEELVAERIQAAWDPAKHVRNPKGAPGGGRFRSMVDRLKDAITEHQAGRGKGDHPFHEFDREQLRRTARARGIELKRGESRDSIAEKLLGHIGGPAPKKGEIASKRAVGQAALDAAPIKMGKFGFERGVEGDLASELDHEALDEYRASGFQDINGMLREGDWQGNEHAWMVHSIDAAMEHSKLTHDVQVHRGVSNLDMFGSYGNSADLTGMEFREPSFASTTADPNVAHEFNRRRGNRGPRSAILTIKVPKGTGAVQLSNLGPAPEPGKIRPTWDEAELLLDRGLTYRITGDRTVDGVRQLEAEVVHEAETNPAKAAAANLGHRPGDHRLPGAGASAAGLDGAPLGFASGVEIAGSFDPSEPRIPGGPHGGEWGSGGGSVGKALKDALKLDGKIDLGPDEKLVGSDKLLADSGSIRMALTETHGKKSLRLGLGGPVFGSREDEAGPWRGSDKVAELNAERKKLSDEEDSVNAELDTLDANPHADPARKAALQKRLDELDELDKGQVGASGYTATLDEGGMQRLHSALADALDKGVAHDRRVNGGYDRLEELDKQLDKMDAMPAGSSTPATEAKYNALLAERQALHKSLDAEDYTIFAEGSVPGAGADVHYRVEFDDPSSGVVVYVGAVPHDSGLDFSDLTSEEQAARLDEAETKKFLRQLQSFAVAPTG